ncbi:MAG: SPASM domain-containing protein [Lachnospiraceae bacterium]|nr:SPASM domain-containing protein [Lachnospiraceae bacterium]
MRTYKVSRFNMLVPMPTVGTMVYNTYSLKYRVLSKDKFSELSKLTKKVPLHESDIPDDYIKAGFFVPSDIDEIQRLKDDIKLNWEKADFMDLAIFTTLACNYRCLYCFEKDHLCNTEHMTKETADEILSFIKRRYDEHPFKNNLRIKWFGGEPLLNVPIIRHISKELKSNNINYSARMYTNGRLLTRELASELKDLGVTDNVVIPIDGLASTYAKLKQCKEEDFYTVVKNIKDCEDLLKIQIHINISEDSKNDSKELYRMLRQDYKIKSQITYSPVSPLNTNKIDSYNNISAEQYINLKNKSTGIKRASGCEARNPNYYVIGPSGEIYICEHLIGQEQYIVDNIKSINDRIDKKGTFWDSDRIIEDCKDCPILPICLGECSTKRYIDKLDCNKELKIIEAGRSMMALLHKKRTQKKESK